MNKRTRSILGSAWLLIATLSLARFWLVRSDLFPQVPESFAIWLAELYGATNAEELRDMETLLALVVAFFLVTVFTAVALTVARRIREPIANQ